MTIRDWLKEGRGPRDLYELLGRPLLDPDLPALLRAVQAANRELHPYQNHRNPDTAKRAIALMGALGRALAVLENAEKLRAYNDKLEARLREELTAGQAEATWGPERISAWLAGEKNVHADVAQRLARRWCSGVSAAPKAPPSPVAAKPSPPPRAVTPAPAAPPRAAPPPTAVTEKPKPAPEAPTAPAPKPNRGRRVAAGVALGVLALLPLAAVPGLFIDRSAPEPTVVDHPPEDPTRGPAAVPGGAAQVRIAEPDRKPEPTEAEVVTRLISELGQGNWKMRRDAAEALGKRGRAAAAAVPALLKLLGDADKLVRDAAADALKLIEPDWARSDAGRAARAALTAALAGADAAARLAALDGLARFGAAAVAAVPDIVKLLDDADRLVRQAAADALKLIDPDRARAEEVRRSATARVAEQVKLLSAPAAATRRTAAAALGQIGPEAADAITPLVVRLADRAHTVRAAAEVALGQVDAGWVRSARAQRAAADLVRLSEANGPESWYAELALARLDEAVAEPAMPDRVKALVNRLLPEDKNRQQQAADLLGDLGPGAATAITALVKALVASHPEVRRAAGEALRQIDANWARTAAARKASTHLAFMVLAANGYDFDREEREVHEAAEKALAAVRRGRGGRP